MAYLSTVTFDHFFGDVQTEAGAFITGGEERVKNMCLCFFINTGAVINNIDVWLFHDFIDFPLNMNHDIGVIHVAVVDCIAAQIPHHLV